MGLIKALAGTIGGQLADQWREFFYCEALDIYTLGMVGKKRESAQNRSSNMHGSDNIISDGSTIAVNDGQCMLIVEQGKIIEICAEPGEFIFDKSSEPSVMFGGLSNGIKKSIDTINRRFTFGGDTGKDQRIYFFNTKEILDNRYGTVSPIPFRVVDNNIGLDIDIAVSCNGIYSFKITDPVLFYTNVTGNFENKYGRGLLDSQLKAELLTALQPAFAKLSAMGIRYSSIPAHTKELAQALNAELSEQWRDLRGLEIIAFGVSSVAASEEDQQMIKELQKTGMMRDPSMAAAAIVTSQSDAMRSASTNDSGAMMGFMGLGMAQQAGGASANDLFAMRQASPNTLVQADESWICSCGCTENKAKFCGECGKPKPATNSWICECGAANTSKFCGECGKPQPEAEPVSQCEKCSWKSPDPNYSPKFCPECGGQI
jgi:membrane protease subunit (stomatin/prohibitin family)